MLFINLSGIFLQYQILLECNCNRHSDECVYDPEVEANRQSMDLRGFYEGGGRCLNCKVKLYFIITLFNLLNN